MIKLKKKYYKVCNTDKSDKIIHAPLSEHELAHARTVLDHNITEIDRLLDEIKVLRIHNFYILHVELFF